MSNKLQELTDKLYTDGLSKGREEGERLLREAKARAEEIISEAREKAASIETEAEKNAADLRSKVESDLRMAAGQCLQATKKDIENLIVASISDNGELSDPDFLKEIIRTVAGKFSSEQSCELNLILPETLRKELEGWVGKELRKAVGEGIIANFSKKISGGFTIGPADGSYFISFTDGTFRELIAEYLRPVTRKLIFGE